LVVDLLRTDQRELTLEQTQQDMKRALDYISDDLREAIYVYSTPTALVANLAATGGALPADARPVLAFWKVQPLNDASNEYTKLSTPGVASSRCQGLTGAELANCDALLIRHGYYELVVYYSTEDNATGIWEGNARIYRYSLPEYSRDALTDPGTSLSVHDVIAENVAGTEGGSPSPNFEAWVPNSAGIDTANTSALVDFVAALDIGAAPNCDAITGIAGVYEPVPDLTEMPTPQPSNSFYVCVRPRDISNNDRLYQDVVVYLQGNANPAGNSLAVQGVSERTELPFLQTQVSVRGVIDKELN
ncbi:MAG: hypothetical protein F6K31_43815, partial [Symploca sp. SIO2G7]|nr:hypothetical protein [Symploca sp. SIO2G7]